MNRVYQTSLFKTIFFFLFVGWQTSAAQSWDFGGFVGGSGYMGDLNPVKPYKINNITFGGQIKRSFDPYWSLKLGVMYGKIEADDAKTENAHFRKRNLNFFTPITEISLQTEFNFFNYVPSVSKKLYTPFLFAGLGVVAFNPKGRYNNQEYDLRLYGTEGQNLATPYRNYALAIPLGAGIKYNVAGNWSLIAEAGFRTAYTDYLDDVSKNYPEQSQLDATLNGSLRTQREYLADPSINKIGEPGTQRGDYRSKDTYIFVGLSITYSIFKNGCPVVAY